MYTVTATEKGQIVIPAKLRKKLRIKKGTKLRVQEDGMRLIVSPATGGYIDSLEGVLNSRENLSQMLIKERRADDHSMKNRVKKWLK